MLVKKWSLATRCLLTFNLLKCPVHPLLKGIKHLCCYNTRLKLKIIPSSHLVSTTKASTITITTTVSTPETTSSTSEAATTTTVTTVASSTTTVWVERSRQISQYVKCQLGLIYEADQEERHCKGEKQHCPPGGHNILVLPTNLQNCLQVLVRHICCIRISGQSSYFHKSYGEKRRD